MKKFFFLISLISMVIVANATEPETYYIHEMFGKIVRGEVSKTMDEMGKPAYVICIHTDRGESVMPAIIRSDGTLDIIWLDVCLFGEMANGFWWNGKRFVPKVVTAKPNCLMYEAVGEVSVLEYDENIGVVFDKEDMKPKFLSYSGLKVCGDNNPTSLSGGYTVEVSDGVLTLSHKGVVTAVIE
jgi:hypothetical protein